LAFRMELFDESIEFGFFQSAKHKQTTKIWISIILERWKSFDQTKHEILVCHWTSTWPIIFVFCSWYTQGFIEVCNEETFNFLETRNPPIPITLHHKSAKDQKNSIPFQNNTTFQTIYFIKANFTLMKIENPFPIVILEKRELFHFFFWCFWFILICYCFPRNNFYLDLDTMKFHVVCSE
jgi:hypothetical protein